MSKSVILAAALTVLGGVALAEHAISLEPEQKPAPQASASAAPQPAETSVAAVPQTVAQVQATLPSELDVYLVPAATREVCTTMTWGSASDGGYSEVRRDCRVEPVQFRQEEQAVRGVCVTRYGKRICY